jgi:hypothetical protein
MRRASKLAQLGSGERGEAHADIVAALRHVFGVTPWARVAAVNVDQGEESVRMRPLGVEPAARSLEVLFSVTLQVGNGEELSYKLP